MLKLILSAGMLAMILIRPQDAVDGARQAMHVWYASVAPALFPFLALMPAITGREACRIYNRLFGRIMEKIFALPGAAAPAAVIGMVAGSPGGAIAIKRIAGEAGIKSSDAHRMALSLVGLSPAYLVIGVGCGICGSAAVGWKLAALQWGIQLALLFLLKGFRFAGDEPCASVQEPNRSGLGSAVETVLGVCGYMVIFGAMSSVAAGILGKKAGTALLLIMDLPGGLNAIDMNRSILPACAAIGFGGICIAAQNMEALRKIGVRWREYLAVRGIAAALFAGGGGILLGKELPQRIPVLNSMSAYAFSLFFSCVIAIPGMIFLSKNLFLNKRKFENVVPDAGKNHQM